MKSEFKIFKPFAERISHGITDRAFGSFNDEESDFTKNLKKLSKKMNIPTPVFAEQVHGDSILLLKDRPTEKPKCDAFITNRTGLPLMVKVADCQGILMFDPINSAIACVHSGWRGSTKNIIGKTIKKMEKEFGIKPKNLLVGISPSLGPCCAEFSDPKNELPDFMSAYLKGKHADFWQLSLDQCMEAGVPKKNIEIARVCTKCDPDCFSHRRGDSGRMAVFITIV
jgi:YfiH family protein